MGFFQDLAKGKVGKAFDTVGNGTIKAITKSSSAAQKIITKPMDIMGDLVGSPMFIPMILVGGVVVLMVMKR